MTATPVSVVVCGVSGCGKSTIAKALATRLGCDFAEGDDYHSAANKAKMQSGVPLNDEDRQPWLALLHTQVIGQHAANGESVVLSCSALKTQYRDVLRGTPPLPVFFVQVAANESVIGKRLRARKGHFMPASLLASQVATFEPLDLATEQGIVVDPALTVDAIVEVVMNQLASASPVRAQRSHV